MVSITIEAFFVSCHDCWYKVLKRKFVKFEREIMTNQSILNKLLRIVVDNWAVLGEVNNQ